MLTDVYCSSCAHAIFDEQWGEYKCKKRERRIYNISDASYCKDYIEKKKEKKKT